MKEHPWLNQPQVKASGKPVLIPRVRHVDGMDRVTGAWTITKPSGDILLRFRRCAELGAAVEAGEEPAGYLYVGKARNQFRYCPFYSRWAEQLDASKLTSGERAAIQARKGGGSNGEDKAW